MRKNFSAGCDIGAYEYYTAGLIDTVGIFSTHTGAFALRLYNNSSPTSVGTFPYLPGVSVSSSNFPVVGDWNGIGTDYPGVQDTSTGVLTLCKTEPNCGQSSNQIRFTFGNPNDTPLSGYWVAGASNAGVGVFRPINGVIYLKNTLATGFADFSMVMGLPSDEGLAGDWTGIDRAPTSHDSPGVYRPNNNTFYLSNSPYAGRV